MNSVVDNFDLSVMESSYEDGCASSYNPRMLMKVVVLRISSERVLRQEDGGSGKISDSFDFGGGEQPRRGVASIYEESDQ